MRHGHRDALICVLALTGLVGAIFVCFSAADAQAARELRERVGGDVRRLAVSLNLYRLERHGWPKRLAELTAGERPYLAELPRDPWGRSYGYLLEAGRPVVVCAGPDGVLGTADDMGTGRAPSPGGEP